MATTSTTHPEPTGTELDLAQFDDAFSEAEVEAPEYGPVPDGRYQVEIEEATLGRSKSSGNPMVTWRLRILGPTYSNRLLWKHSVIGEGERMTWLKQDLMTCGLEIEKISELPDQLEKLTGVKLEVSKRTKGDYENIYFNRKIVLSDPPEQDGVPF